MDETNKSHLLVSSNTSYGQDYKEGLFYQWYAAGRPSMQSFLNMIDEDKETHRRPSIMSLRSLQAKEGWNERADLLDSEAAKKMDASVIERRVEMFNRHEKIGREMVEMAYNYFKEKGIDNSSVALKALIQGMAIEQKTAGVGDALLKISEMSNDQLQKEFYKLLGRENVVDADGISEIDDKDEDEIENGSDEND